jgi:hypothetical protein
MLTKALYAGVAPRALRSDSRESQRRMGVGGSGVAGEVGTVKGLGTGVGGLFSLTTPSMVRLPT